MGLIWNSLKKKQPVYVLCYCNQGYDSILRSNLPPSTHCTRILRGRPPHSLYESCHCHDPWWKISFHYVKTLSCNKYVHVLSIKFNAFLNHILRYKPLIFKQVNLTRHVIHFGGKLPYHADRTLNDCII